MPVVHPVGHAPDAFQKPSSLVSGYTLASSRMNWLTTVKFRIQLL